MKFVCFVSKLVFFFFKVWCFSPKYQLQEEQSATGTNWRSCRNVQTPYPSDCWPHATSEPAGIWTLIWFLILAALNSCLQNHCGENVIASPGSYNMHVCLISRRRGNDDAVQVVMNLDFMKSPSLLERQHVKSYFTFTEHLHFYYS